MNTILFKTVQTDANTARSGTVSFEFEGKILTAPGGISVAAALLQNQVLQFRDSPVSGEPRAPYCQMGICFECLVQINGVQNRQACMITVEEGMKIRMQRGQTAFTIVQTGDAE